MDLKFCNTTLDLSKLDKENSLPNELTATVWKQSRYLTTGVLIKNAIEFTDPSGRIESPFVPLNTWVQTQKNFVREYNVPDVEPRGCIEPHNSSIIFKDQRDDDAKVVTVSDNDVTLTPFDERFCFVVALPDARLTFLPKRCRFARMRKHMCHMGNTFV